MDKQKALWRAIYAQYRTFCEAMQIAKMQSNRGKVVEKWTNIILLELSATFGVGTSYSLIITFITYFQFNH